MEADVPFPVTPREEYDKNPLEEVICQLRFPTILKIGAAAPVEFQERIRKLYPNYEEAVESLQIPRALSELVSQLQISVPSISTKRYRFSTSDDSRSVVLTPEFLAFTEAKYQRWTTLKEQIQFVEREFRSVYSPEFYSRVGLRYRDKIVRSKLDLANVDWRELLNPDLTGFLGDDAHAGLVRKTRGEVEMALPGMEGDTITLRHGLIHDGGLKEDVYVMDIDLHTQARSTPEDVYGILDRFNAVAGNFFRWAVGARLRNALVPRRLGEEQ